MRFLIFLALCAAVAGALAAAVEYTVIDQRVAERLSSPQERGITAFYSDIAKIESSTPANQVEEQLLKRRYRLVDGTPSTPGDFRRIGDRFEILTREFLAPDGRTVTSRLAKWPSGITASAPLLLEAQVISVLGGSTRASEQRPLSAFPAPLIQAVVSIEDERFRHHIGIDFEGIARALFNNLLAGRIVQGGSTITQQLAKNLLFSRERSFRRKILEALAAISIERRLTKAQILEMYMNEVYLGQEGSIALHGFEAAARAFLGKRVEDLSLAESALLAGIIQAPSLYSPRRHPSRARERRDTVLRKLRELDYIDAAELRAALQAPIRVIKENLHQRRAPHYITEVTQLLESQLGNQGMQLPGLAIFTGLDLDLQLCAERAVRKALPGIEKQHPKLKRRSPGLEVGLVSIEPFSGKVKAWVGGRDYTINQFDHVARAKRQIGSTIKPFLYLTALDGTLNSYRVATPLSVLSDEPVRVDLVTRNTWEPENYDKEFHGDVTVRYALERSLNIPAVQVLQRVGVPAFVSTLRKFHLAQNLPEVPSLALGTVDTSLLELTAAFGALANGGTYIQPRPYISVLDESGNSLVLSEIQEQRVAEEAPTYVLTNILQGAVNRGTGTAIRSAGYSLPVAGKTGTSNEARDLWFVGYTPDLVTGVWLGFDDNSKVGLTGGTAAAPVWAEYMKCASAFRVPSDFILPRGVVVAKVDPKTGLQSTEDCPVDDPIQEVFVAGTEPSPACIPEPSAHSNDADSATRRSEDRPPRRRSLWEQLFDF